MTHNERCGVHHDFHVTVEQGLIELGKFGD